MKINLTQDEYRHLLDMLYISDWVINSLSQQDNENNPYQLLRNKLLSYIKETEIDNVVLYSQEHEQYLETLEYEDTIFKKFLDPYEKQIFWERLVDGLAVRDLVKKIGSAKYTAMDRFDCIEKQNEIAKKYLAEFKENGLENLGILTK